jgi:hypothetical protein
MTGRLSAFSLPDVGDPLLQAIIADSACRPGATAVREWRHRSGAAAMKEWHRRPGAAIRLAGVRLLRAEKVEHR